MRTLKTVMNELDKKNSLLKCAGMLTESEADSILATIELSKCNKDTWELLCRAGF